MVHALRQDHPQIKSKGHENKGSSWLLNKFSLSAPQEFIEHCRDNVYTDVGVSEVEIVSLICLAAVTVVNSLVYSLFFLFLRFSPENPDLMTTLGLLYLEVKWPFNSQDLIVNSLL